MFLGAPFYISSDVLVTMRLFHPLVRKITSQVDPPVKGPTFHKGQPVLSGYREVQSQAQGPTLAHELV